MFGQHFLPETHQEVFQSEGGVVAGEVDLRGVILAGDYLPKVLSALCPKSLLGGGAALPFGHEVLGLVKGQVGEGIDFMFSPERALA